MQQEIIGVVEGKCKFIQLLPGNKKMECDYTNEMQIKVAESTKDFYQTGDASLKITSDSLQTTSTINNEINPMQEALASGQCVILDR